MKDQWTVRLPRSYVLEKIKEKVHDRANQYQRTTFRADANEVWDVNKYYVAAAHAPATKADQDYIELDYADLFFFNIPIHEAHEKAL